MINQYDILETIRMIQDECLDIRTITMGISLLDCIDPDIDKACKKVYEKITSKAKNLVSVGEQIEKELGIPIINKRISVTPIAMISAAGINVAKVALINLSAYQLTGNLMDLFNIKAIILGILIFIGQKKLKWSPVIFIALSAVVGILLKF